MGVRWQDRDGDRFLEITFCMIICMSVLYTMEALNCAYKSINYLVSSFSHSLKSSSFFYKLFKVLLLGPLHC